MKKTVKAFPGDLLMGLLLDNPDEIGNKMKEIKNNSIKADVSGSISISNATTMRQRQIESNSNFFEAGQDYIIKVDDEKIVITRPSIDSKCRTYKATKMSSGWIRFQILGELLLGKFEFDSIDSDVDRAVIYYR